MPRQAKIDSAPKDFAIACIVGWLVSARSLCKRRGHGSRRHRTPERRSTCCTVGQGCWLNNPSPSRQRLTGCASSVKRLQVVAVGRFLRRLKRAERIEVVQLVLRAFAGAENAQPGRHRLQPVHAVAAFPLALDVPPSQPGDSLSPVRTANRSGHDDTLTIRAAAACRFWMMRVTVARHAGQCGAATLRSVVWVTMQSQPWVRITSSI